MTLESVVEGGNSGGEGGREEDKSVDKWWWEWRRGQPKRRTTRSELNQKSSVSEVKKEFGSQRPPLLPSQQVIGCSQGNPANAGAR